MNICPHAQKRLRQRGLSDADIRLIFVHGTETRDGYLLRDKDVIRAEKEMRSEICRLHRLAGKYMVSDGDTLITSYHPRRKRQKRILRGRSTNS
jgi:hypothetical protein